MSVKIAPLPDSINIGERPTDLKARTGELTPPGNRSTASLYASIEFVNFFNFYTPTLIIF